MKKLTLKDVGMKVKEDEDELILSAGASVVISGVEVDVDSLSVGSGVKILSMDMVEFNGEIYIKESKHDEIVEDIIKRLRDE